MDLRRFRIAKKLTQAEVAKQIGVTASSYAMYERGERTPNIDVLCKLSIVFGVDLDTLAGVEKQVDSNQSLTIEKPSDRVDVLLAPVADLLRTLPPESQERAIPLIEAALRAVGLLE